MPIRTLFGLLFCNLLWSAAYSISKNLMQHYRPLEVAFLRYTVASVPLLFFCLRGGRKSLLAVWARNIGTVDSRIFIVGILTFFLSPLCQMTGLSMSRAIDGSLMIAMEPLFTILSAFVLLGERVRPIQIFSIGLAVAGAGVLTELTWEKVSSFSDARLVGNAIFALSMLSEAAYSTVAKPALDARSPVLFMTIALCTGSILLLGYNIFMDGPERMGGLAILASRSDWRDMASIAYLGLGCTAFAYLYWMIVLQNTAVSSMALTLYVQPVLGTFWGHAFLGEEVTRHTIAGGIVIFIAVWLGSRPPSVSTRGALTVRE